MTTGGIWQVNSICICTAEAKKKKQNKTCGPVGRLNKEGEIKNGQSRRDRGRGGQQL